MTASIDFLSYGIKMPMGVSVSPVTLEPSNRSSWNLD